MPRVDKSKTNQDTGKEIRLIELIGENPELYEHGHPLYRDNNRKRIVWECISQEMNTPVETLKKMWKKLRANYTKKCRDLDVEKMTKSTPCDEALAFLMTSVMKYANENNCGNNTAISPGTGDDRMPGSSPRLTSISEEERSSTVTLVSDEASNAGVSGTSPQENFATGKKSDRVLRPRYSEPARLASNENLVPGVDVASRRLTSTPTTPRKRSRTRKLIRDPNYSTTAFFDSMAITVASFPQYLQAVVKLQICKIVSETERDLSSPKIP